MPLPIAIDVGVTEPPRELATVLVESCTRAAADTSCYLVKEAPEGPYTALAVITWDRDDKVRIEVGLRREQGTEWRTRQLSFQPGDVAVERYRSVGFVIGALATATKDEAPEATEAPPPEEPPKPAPPVVAPAPSRPKKTIAIVAPERPTPARGFIGVSGMIGSPLDRGGPRLGGNLRVGFRVAERVSVLVAAGLSTRPRDDAGLRLTWLDAGAGLAFTLGSPVASHLELRLECLVEQFAAEARRPSRAETRTRVLPALRPGIDGVLRLGSVVALVGGVDLVGRPSTTKVFVEDVARGSTNWVEVGGSLGFRVQF